MHSSRKIIWGAVALLVVLSAILILFLKRKGAEFSVEGERAGIVQHKNGEGVQPSRYPYFTNSGIPVSTKDSAKDGLTLKTALSFVSKDQGALFAIQSVSNVFPDGTSARFAALVATSGVAYRVEIGNTGIMKSEKSGAVPKGLTSFPGSIPDSPDALLQLTANPYFKEAQVVGIAYYFDEMAKHWSYVVRTNLGDVSIVTPLTVTGGLTKPNK